MPGTSSSKKAEDVANFIERRRLERLEKSKQREAMVRKMKLDKANASQTSAIKAKSKLIRSNSQRAPVVRQTLTSKKRFDKANLTSSEYDDIREIIKSKYALNGKDGNQVQNECLDDKTLNDNIVRIQSVNENIFLPEASNSQITQNKPNNRLTNQNNLTSMNKTGAIPKENIVTKPLVDNLILPTSANHFPKRKSRKHWGSPKPIHIDSIIKLEVSKNLEGPDIVSAIDMSLPNQNKDKMRRSISSIHRNKMNIDEARKCIRRSQSMRVLSTPAKSVIEENYYSENIVQRTPKLKICIPKPADLQKRLMKWLETRGKPLSNFKNLHMFGINKTSQILEHDKENIPGIEAGSHENHVQKLDETFEDLAQAEIVQSTPKIDNLNVVEAILKDLYGLIIEGYPKEQCDDWLEIIKHQYKTLTKLPIYWECKALLQSNDGDFQSAIESYQKAVTEGAEPVNIEDKLNNLFDRICDLNIDPKSLNAPAIGNFTLNQSADNKNAFASRIIKFAVRQKRKPKKNEEEVYFATPVRRSSRIWARTPLSATSHQNVQIFNTLNSLDDSIRKSILFTPNSALDTS